MGGTGQKRAVGIKSVARKFPREFSWLGKGRGQREKGKFGRNLLELVLLRRLVFARFGGLPVQLLCCELGLEKRFSVLYVS